MYVRISDIAKMSGVSAAYVRNQLSRGNFMFEDGDLINDAAHGEAHQLSFDGAMRLALFLRLSDLGHWMEGKEHIWQYISLVMDFSDDAGREPGEVFSEGITLLIGDTSDLSGRVVRADPETPLWSLFEPSQLDFFAINISQLAARIKQSSRE